MLESLDVRAQTPQEKLKRIIWPRGKAYARILEDGQVAAGLTYPGLVRNGRDKSLDVDREEAIYSNKAEALRALNRRRREETIRAMALRGAEDLAMSVTGIGIIEGIRKKSLKNSLVSLATGGTIALGAALLSEEYRERAQNTSRIRHEVIRAK